MAKCEARFVTKALKKANLEYYYVTKVLDFDIEGVATGQTELPGGKVGVFCGVARCSAVGYYLAKLEDCRRQLRKEIFSVVPAGKLGE